MHCPRIDHFIRLNNDGTVGKCGHMINAKGFKSYEELEKLVNDWLNGDSADDSAPESYTARGGKPESDSASSQADTSAKYRSLDEAFADLETL